MAKKITITIEFFIAQELEPIQLAQNQAALVEFNQALFEGKKIVGQSFVPTQYGRFVALALR